MSCGEDEVARVTAPNQLDQGQARFGVHHIVVFADDVEDGTGDIAQVDWLTTNLKTVLDQEVFAEELLRHLAENLPGQGHVAVHPLLEQLKHLRIPLFVLVAVEADRADIGDQAVEAELHDRSGRACHAI